MGKAYNDGRIRRALLVLPSLVSLLLFSTLSVSRAFPFLSGNRIGRTSRLAAASMDTNNDANGLATESGVPNWRVISKSNGSAVEDLKRESPWSSPSYLEALSLYDRLIECEDEYMAPRIKEALHCLEGAYRLYGSNLVVGSYNGGKDAVVIMHLMRAAHAHNLRKRQDGDGNPVAPHRPRVIYFENKHEFPEVTAFLRESVRSYDLDMLAFDRTHSFSDGLRLLVEEASPVPLSFILGTRQADPNAGSQGLFAPSSDWMPPFMRVNPILYWNYGHVWHFLRLFQLPYCSLYDEGYTSLGNVKDTLPCPALSRPQGGYWPAYMLSDWGKERAGRIPKVKETPKIPSSPSTINLTNTDQDIPPPPKETTVQLSPSTSSTVRPKTVGLIIIGDEILKGLTPDTNTHKAATALRAHNVPLSRVVVISDDHDLIVQEINRMQREVDTIITSGGVGPTHDDVTMKSVSVALSSPLVINPQMVRLLKKKMKTDEGAELTEAQIKMATLPEVGKLRYFGGADWPILQCRNIFVLPGVPDFFAAKMDLLGPHLATEGAQKSITYKVVLGVDETSIVNSLNKVVESHPNVSFGSYPFVSHPEFKTVVTLEGKESPWQNGSNVAGSFRKEVAMANFEKSISDLSTDSAPTLLFSKADMDMNVKLALEELLDSLPKGSVLRVDNDDHLM